MKTIHTDYDDAVAQTAAVLSDGGVVVVPTDTVYGLAARPVDADAVQKVFRAKGRPEGMHLPVLAATVDHVLGLGVAFGPAADRLARWWWPGPLTRGRNGSQAAAKWRSASLTMPSSAPS
jgi:tRNA A37 threonylcarbamoyladenosine synthetase subunit TsaC/SUA5/YrdC